MTSKQAEAPDPRIYGFNPISHHYVKKSGAVWLRLVKAGMAEDSELMQQIKDKALTRKKAASEEKKAPAARKTPKPKPDGKTKAERAARKLVDSKRSELDGLESDAVVEQIRKLKLKRSTLASADSDWREPGASSESDSEESEPVSRRPPRPSASTQSGSGPLADRIRLKSQPIPIPARATADRRAALRQSLEQAISSDED